MSIITIFARDTRNKKQGNRPLLWLAHRVNGRTSAELRINDQQEVSMYVCEKTWVSAFYESFATIYFFIFYFKVKKVYYYAVLSKDKT